MPGTLPTLCPAQLHRILRAYRISGREVLDVGPQVDWPSERRNKVRTLTDRHDVSDPAPTDIERVELPASLAVRPHSCSMVIIRQARLLHTGNPTDFEPIVALANLLSCLKARGFLLAVLAEPADAAHWDRLLAGFPGKGRVRQLTAGLFALPWLARLTRPAPPVHLLEFRLPRKRISRLDWHQLARQRILQRRPAAA